MKILDAQGRLFGKLSILDAGAALVILLVVFGIFLFPGTSGSSVAQVGAAQQPLEVDVIVRGLSATDPKSMIKEGDKVKVVVRKQSSGEATITTIRYLPRSIAVPQPDGSVKALPDPRPEMVFSTDMVMTLKGKAQINKEGTPVLGGEKVKVGVPIELEGPTYNFTSSTIAVRIK